MTRLLLAGALAAATALAGCGGPRVDRAATGRCAHVRVERRARGVALCEDAFLCERPPGGPFDRVGLRRLAPCQGSAGPVLLYLPGAHMNAELAVGQNRYDLRVHLAAAGFRVWGLDYRTHAVPADAAPDALDTLAGWTPEVFTADAAWAVGFVRTNDPGPVVLAGFSYGAGLAYRVATALRGRLAGLVILDGAADSTVPPTATGPAIDVGSSRLPFAARRRLLAAVLAAPGNPSPVPGFRTAGAALAEILWTSPAFGGNGGLSAARDGTSDIRAVARLLATYDRWWPAAALGGGPPRPPSRAIPVLAFASGRMGPAWVARVRASAEAFGGGEAVVRELPGHGHLDVLVGKRAPFVVYEPVRQWIAQRR